MAAVTLSEEVIVGVAGMVSEKDNVEVSDIEGFDAVAVDCSEGDTDPVKVTVTEVEGVTEGLIVPEMDSVLELE